ncbi:MAG: IS1380 family transposase [Desulfofustis sp. PB-SRB1]|jgi:hypothetical protein|nr:IS1380 family transposase [Desulfofustis sp. PB-SRB1]
MKRHTANNQKKKHQIDAIEVTSDCLTSRAGLAPCVAYMNQIGIFTKLERYFGSLRKSKKGLPLAELFKQVLCFMFDGTSRHVSHFDQLAADHGYGAAIETDPTQLASSHQIKRMFGSFFLIHVLVFRRLLAQVFIRRLGETRPAVVELGLDSMVMDNDDARCRNGVTPTYQKKKGFQPLQMNWGRLIIDAEFRPGKVHGNHGDTARRMITDMVRRIRRHYRNDVPIIIRMDSGFFDQKIFELCEHLKIGYVCGGKMYYEVKAVACSAPAGAWQQYTRHKNDEVGWEYLEFGTACKTWKRFRRALYCRFLANHRQLYLPDCRPDTVIVTNLSQGGYIDELLERAGMADYTSTHSIVAVYHGRGSDELNDRSLKDFGHEQLPFKQFTANAAWYYMMVLGYNLLECYKYDVAYDVVPTGAYATTIRRRLIDIAGKIVRHAHKTVLKVSAACAAQLNLAELLHRCRQVQALP